ncbi:MAG TPA: TonB-dependent receptor [Candidatus Acidoferrales bacterium]|nr:TonB-dependent receptor [Candidatus Acidoferrales bacterium]
MRRTMPGKLRALLVSICFCAGVASAQDGVTITGSTQDPSGAAIAGEALTLTSKATSQSRHTATDREGRFSFADVVPGEYTLRGEAEGFRRAEIKLSVGNERMNDITLPMLLGRNREEVSVSARLSQLDAPENNAGAFNVNADFFAALPSQSQDIVGVVSNYLAPAAQGSEGVSVVVDGMESSAMDLPANAIKRITINRDPYAPEFRRPGSGRVEVTTRNGSRSYFDGNVAFYERNDVFDARNAFALEKPHLDRNTWDASLGGPLPFRRTRFLLSASRLTDKEDAVVNATTLQGPLLRNAPTSQTTNNVLGRVDFRPSAERNFSLVYTFSDRPAEDRGVGGLRLPENGIRTNDVRNALKFWYTDVLSPSLFNTLRFSAERESERAGTTALAPEIEVSGAFIGGPNPSSFSQRANRVEVQDIVDYVRGPNTFRFGAGVLPKFLTADDATNFGGIFHFPSLAALQAGSPDLLQIVRGNPDISFTKHEAYGFAQDVIRIRQHITLMLGSRYEWQESLGRQGSFAPRLAFAWAPGQGKTVFRAGAGIFRDRLSDRVLEQVHLLNNIQESEFIVRRPLFPVPSLSGAEPSIWQLAPDIRMPYLFQGTFGVERTMAAMRGSLEYRYLRGVHLFRAVDVNAPATNGVRPDPTLFLDRQIQSVGLLRSNAVIATLQGNIAKAVKFKMQYTFSHSDDNTGGPFDLPANSRQLGPEWGRSSFDARHRVVLSGTSDLPANFRIGLLLVASSGRPFNITTGSDDNGDGIDNDRPSGVTRNTGNGPGLFQTDLRLSKIFKVYTGALNKDGDVSAFRRIELNVDAFNLFNRTNLTDIIGETSSPRFGQAIAALAPRTIQLSLKFSFRADRD